MTCRLEAIPKLAEDIAMFSGHLTLEPLFSANLAKMVFAHSRISKIWLDRRAGFQ